MQAIALASPETRRALSKYGLVIPQFGRGATITIKYGYLCRQCNSMALYFIGDRFVDHMGNEMEKPPSSVAIDLIPWQQDLAPEHINRHTPMCQKCFHAIALHHRNLRDNLIVQVTTWEESRGTSERALAKMRRERVIGGRSLADVQTHVKGADLSSDFGAHGPKKISDLLSPEAKKDIRDADALGVLHRPVGHGL